MSTPRGFYEALDAHFHFDFDPAPLNPTFDGLADDTRWGESNFVNPPYSDIESWMRKAVREGKQTVFLVPVRTNALYARKYMYGAISSIYLLADSLQFVGYNRGWATPLMLVLMNARERPPWITELDGLPVFQLEPTANPAAVDNAAHFGPDAK